MDTVVSDVAGRFASAAIQVCCLLGSLKDDLSDLKDDFERIQANLHDAEENQPKNESDKKSLKFLKSASLEVENVLDEAKTEDMIRNLHGVMGRNYMLRTFFTSHNLLMVNFTIALKIKNIRKKLDKITAEGSGFQSTPTNITEDAAGIGSVISNRATSSGMPNDDIYGREKEKKMIVGKICNHDDDGVPRVYAIWGMGGVGKTTLAKLVYNDETVKKHFELECYWVYVSAVFDVKRIIEDICGLEDKKLDGMSLDYSLRQLQNKLEGKKYFIIMDDVWIKNKDMNEWEKLCSALRRGAEGSTVMVTTREKDTVGICEL